MQVHFTRYFGVQAAFHQKFYIWGPITMRMFVIFLVAFLLMMAGNQAFVNDVSIIPEVFFDFNIIFITLYSLYHPSTNPKKDNLQLFWMSFTPTISFFQSISTEHYLVTRSIFAVDKNGPHRLHVSRADLRGE